MKISFNWLKDLVALPPEATAAEVGRRLTMAGLEVESIEARGHAMSGVRVAEVRAVRPHPSADKLRIVRLHVSADAEPDQDYEVVCGAPNVPARGGRVAWAAPGAVLPGGVTIGRKEVRGVDSPGMICSEKELGLSDAAAGIMILSPQVPVGADLAVALGLADQVLEVNVTPNRPDALSHGGIAREVAAAFGVGWRFPALEPAAVDKSGPAVAVEVRDAGACPRYQATTIREVRVAASPPAIRFRLAACGVRAISNLVDVTNYVMLETGHPLHAFDLDKLEGGIVVRRAAAGETIRTLDGVERTLDAQDIVIADGAGPVALAGVMGGARTEVTAATTNVLLEAATFDPRSVRRTAKRLGLHSESSHRFERGVDAAGVPLAGARAAALITRLAGGQVAHGAVDVAAPPAAPRQVTLGATTLGRVAGFEIPLDLAAAKLRAIEIPAAVANEVLVATVPSFRPDVTIEEDLVEEVMRLVGYDQAPARLPQGGKAPAPSPERLADRARDALAALGLHEIAGWAFVPQAKLTALGDATLMRGIGVKNPISADYEVMRTSLLPGLAEAARHNLAHGVADVRLFEVGPIVLPAAGEAHHLHQTYAAALIVGRRSDWLKPGAPVDFFDLKRIVVEFFAALGAPSPVFGAIRTSAAPSFLHPGVSAALVPTGETGRSGWAGELHPAVARRLGIEVPAFYFEVRLDALEGRAGTVRAVALARFPSTTRDISFWIDDAVNADSQSAAMRSAGERLLRDLAVLEDFRDPRFVPAGKKGMLWTLTYRADDRTLADAEVDAAHARVVASLKASLPIQIR